MGTSSLFSVLDTNFLFASLIWGTVGMGYCIYGKKQRQWVPMVGGVSMIAVSYLCGSALLMSLLSIGIMVGVYFLLREGY